MGDPVSFRPHYWARSSPGGLLDFFGSLKAQAKLLLPSLAVAEYLLDLTAFLPLHPQDEKYWSRRYKNNEAAKRSRDARRLKENQISVRAAFLEKENALLRQEVVAVRQELSHYRAVLSRYQAQHGAL